jgi:hypothetical protein
MAIHALSPGRVPLQSGYAEPPQSCKPAFRPLRAVRKTIGFPHRGNLFHVAATLDVLPLRAAICRSS